jgi:hypothetical protein
VGAYREIFGFRQKLEDRLSPLEATDAMLAMILTNTKLVGEGISLSEGTAGFDWSLLVSRSEAANVY